jgi:hypothetical protein
MKCFDLFFIPKPFGGETSWQDMFIWVMAMPREKSDSVNGDEWRLRISIRKLPIFCEAISPSLLEG